MEKYWEGVKNTEEIDRGLYIILPLRYQGDFQKIPFSAKKTNTDQNNKSDEERDRSGFDSDDFLEILSIKCRQKVYAGGDGCNGKEKMERSSKDPLSL